MKRNFAPLSALSVLLGLGVASAEAVPVDIDGCAELARVVYSEVQASALRGPGQSGPWLINPGTGDIHICQTAAKTVSQAFSQAMSSAGRDMRWDHSRVRRGDYCQSGILSQCYPDTNLAYSGMSRSTSYVQKSWMVVLQAVMGEMHNPISSDEVRFRKEDLKLRLGLGLRSIRSQPDY
ncbi:MAG: hypothetical protein K0U72_10500 [Gammaproteobacteria bacterium]|nr:hypothetical protein [Gammaproteobacteria bacterium]